MKTHGAGLGRGNLMLTDNITDGANFCFLSKVVFSDEN